MKRRLLSLLLALVMVLGLAVPAFAFEEEEEPNGTLYDAMEMKLRTEYWGVLYAVSDEVDMYHFTAEEDTYLTLHLSGGLGQLNFVLFDGAGNVITEAVHVGRDVDGMDWYELQRDITAGEYYLGVFALDGDNHGYQVKLYLGEAYYDAGYHDWYASKPITPATCTTEGVALYQCRCGETKTDVAPVNPEAHTWEITITEAPTCDTYGRADHTCTSCGLVEEHYVDPEHSGRVDVVVKEPTVDESGYGGFYCTDCGWEEYEHWIAPLNHHFIDVKPDSFYDDPVKWAYSMDITSGSDAYHFSPNGQCLRAQVVTFLWRAEGCPEPASTANPFVDVKETDFYYKAVLWAVENGITTGSDATHFNPFGVCNRAQVVTFLHRAKGSPAPESTDLSFTDVAAGSFYEQAVLWAVENGITNGLSATEFGPNVPCNRAQVVTFLYRAASLAAVDPDPDPDTVYYFAMTTNDTDNEIGFIYPYGVEYKAGDTVQFYAEPWFGYLVEFTSEPEVEGLELRYLGAYLYELTMPAHDLTIHAEFVPAQGSHHTITTSCTNGEYITNADYNDDFLDIAKPGEHVLFYIYPDDGFTLTEEHVSVTANGAAVEDFYFLGEFVDEYPEDDIVIRYFLCELVMPDADVSVSINCTEGASASAAQTRMNADFK